ncbi:hypothetical protein [Streptomyces olivochromogenes]|uniref:Uncharacterized protein n=1 Tax=Streptomyces olivochromogenes TaxID=1963 RepID=A0A250VJ62_STROL|nr:hypothetical protein [Streptomyces olivochromogenes]GAX54089.1 hypothetical protein SO3561_05623 [Streptomyces olivochromogenes]
MRSLAITWTLWSHGWAFVKVADDQGEAEIIASYVTDGPEQFLYAVARLVLGDGETLAELEGEPQKPYLNRSWNVQIERSSWSGDLPAVRA